MPSRRYYHDTVCCEKRGTCHTILWPKRGQNRWALQLSEAASLVIKYAIFDYEDPLAGSYLAEAAMLLPVGRVLKVAKAARAANGLRKLESAAEFGIKEYKDLRKALKGSALEAHHLIEKRFADTLGLNPRQMQSIAVTRPEHQALTNAWRRAIPYGEGTRQATEAQIMDAARQIYADMPEVITSIGLW